MDRALLFPNEKIGFVVAVLLLILVGIAVLLIRQDRRLARLERELRAGDGAHVPRT